MYGNHLYFDELSATGNKIRIKNRLKAKNLMVLAVNFIDEDTLSKIQELFLDLSPEDMEKFKTYLTNRHYLSKSSKYAEERKILAKVANVALLALPSDENLQKIMNDYNKNLKIIDDLKIKATKTCDPEQLTELILTINDYNEQNIKLLEQINNYRNKKYEKTSEEE